MGPPPNPRDDCEKSGGLVFRDLIVWKTQAGCDAIAQIYGHVYLRYLDPGDINTLIIKVILMY